MAKKKLYALDFDGVICDSAVETGITGWKVASQLWQDMPAETPADIINQFRQVRPVMETGYEAILIIRLLFEGIHAENLLNDFSGSINTLIDREILTVDEFKALFGETRDHWIERDLDEWVRMNPLFDSIASKLKQLDPKQCYIITTKQERFVSHILDANKLTLPPEQIFGLDRKLSKQQVLADLLTLYPEHTILFVEDRLPTLKNVIDDQRLAEIELFFADWGYNTQQDKQDVTDLPVTAINLADFASL
jgi:phosphoglycolate phosphatase-like HAD superfamily hydrolase